MTDVLKTFRDEARRLDRADPLKKFRRRFATPPGTIYLDGNSLGLLSRDSEASLVKAVKSW
ncbi:MAG: kynU, partial [Candidatus Aminicenantes bacterium]|nr:kynU [Candidatus Aminicenantes bacterium]